MAHIFVSYSRKDINKAERIIRELAQSGLDTWVDWNSIPKGEDFEREIAGAIEDADAFLFLISPDSVKSQWCEKEIEFAVRNNKRILPVLIHDTDLKDVHREISNRNWIFFRDEKDDLATAINGIKKSINTDYEWVKFHTELQVKALRWERVNEPSRLLRGKELQEVERRLTEIGGKLDPRPTDLQIRFVYASRSNANRQRNWIVFAGAGNILLVLFMAIYIGYLSRQVELLRTQNITSATFVLQSTKTPNPTNTLSPTSTETLIPVATSTPLLVVIITPELPVSTPVSIVQQIYEEKRNETAFWLISIFTGIFFTYLTGLAAVLVIWWRFGGEFFSRSWLLKFAAKPLLITPGLGKWTLFLGYKKRLLARPEIKYVSNNYFGLPARRPAGDDILPDASGENLHLAIADALAPQQPVIVTGKGGAGKTTLLSRIAFLALNNQLPHSLRGFRPVLIPSVYYEGNFLDTITSVLRARDGVPLDKSMLKAQLETGKYLILFDGISELEGDQTKKLHDILSFAQNSDYKNNRFLFTSRPSFVIPSELPVFQLNPLTPDVIFDLLPRYSLGIEKEKQIRRQLESFGAMPIEPLLFTMILSQDDKRGVSTTRSQLYERYFRRLLRAESDTTWNGWCVILEAFAQWFLIDSGSRGVGILHEPLIDLMKEKKSLSEFPKTLLERAQEYYDLPVKNELSILRLLKSAGIIQETKQWRFAHDTFGEYFAAGYLLSVLERTKKLPDLGQWKNNDTQINSFVGVVEFVNELAEKSTRKLLLESDLPIVWRSILNQEDSGEK